MHKSLNLIIKNVEDLMYQRGLKRTDLGQLLKISPQAVSRLLSGTHVPGVDKVESLAVALGVPAFTLFMSPEERSIWDKANTPLDPRDDQMRAMERRLRDLEAKLLPQTHSIKEDLAKK